MQKNLKIIIIGVICAVFVIIAFVVVGTQIYSGHFLKEYFDRGRLEAEVIVVRTGEVKPVLRVQGAAIYDVVPKSRTEVYAKTNGKIIECYAKPFDYVKEGQLLAKVDTRDLEMQKIEAIGNVQSVEALLYVSEQEVFRNKKLLAADAVSLEEYEKSKATRDSNAGQFLAAKAKVAQIDINIADASIIAPKSGVLNAAYITPGKTVSAGDNVFTIIDNSSYIMKVYMTKALVDNLSEGMEMTILPMINGNLSDSKKENIAIRGRLLALDVVNKSFSGSIIAVIDVILGAEGGIKFKQKNIVDYFMEGLFLVLPFKKDAVLIPAGSCYYNAPDYFVVAIDDNDIAHVRKIEVSDSDAGSGLLEVLGNLQPGERILKNGVNYIKDGEKVTVKEVVSY